MTVHNILKHASFALVIADFDLRVTAMGVYSGHIYCHARF